MSINLEKATQPKFWVSSAKQLPQLIKKYIAEILITVVITVMLMPLIIMAFGDHIADTFIDFDAWRLCNNVTTKCTILPKSDWNHIGEFRFEDRTNPENVKTFYHCTQDRIKLDRYK